MKLIKIIFIQIVLIVSLQSLTKADDIRDFQIEGMSIGDSLLDYMTLQEIKQKEKFDYSGKYTGIVLNDKTFSKFDDMQLAYKNNNKYIIHSLAGRIHFDKKKLSECLTLKDKIELELSEIFNNTSIVRDEKRKHDYDKNGKSFIYATWYNLDDGSSASIICFDWSKGIEKNITDKLTVGTTSNEFNNFLNNEAYK
jgi:hypothetical protein